MRRLGYRTRVHLVPHDRLDAPLDTIQVIPAAWGDTSHGMFATWFACDGPNVHGWFCDRRVDRWLERAQALKATNPRAAAAIWARIDRRLVDLAAWVPTVDGRGIDFVSERLRSYQFHPRLARSGQRCESASRAGRRSGPIGVVVALGLILLPLALTRNAAPLRFIAPDGQPFHAQRDGELFGFSLDG